MPMRYNTLGRSGLLVSELSFGSWVTFSTQVDITAAYEMMLEAFKAGINFFDNAETYARGESEKVMGEAIKMGIQNGDWIREDLVLSTKVFFGWRDGVNNRGCSRKHIIEGTIAALKRLQVDYVDLLFCHRPDPVTPIEETVRAMHTMVESGRCFYWGTSEWNAQQITEAMRVADKYGLHRPIMDQCEFNLFKRDRVEREYLPLYKEYGYGLTTWSPLATGILTGKYSGMQVPEGSRLALENFQWLKDIKFTKNKHQIEKTDLLRPVAEELGCTLAQLAIAWCVANKHVSTVILGATSVKQLQENLKALDIVPKLTPELLARIDAIVESKPQLDDVTQSVTNYRAH